MMQFRLMYVPFPESISGIVKGMTGLKPGKDHCLVIVDRDLPEELKLQTLKHELSHILLGHFDDRTKGTNTYLKNLAEVEDEADRYADQMTDEELSYLMTYRIG